MSASTVRTRTSAERMPHAAVRTHATPTSVAMMPMTALRRRCSGGCAATAGAGSSTDASTSCASGSATAHPWVDEVVTDVHGRVYEQVGDCEDQHGTLQHREVLLRDGLRDEGADAAEAEQLLDDDRAADQSTEVDARK